MSKVQDIFGASPKSVLNKPMMHVQEQQANGVDGGGSSTGANDRVPNTVLTNEIAGASLAVGVITLPAGTYYAEGLSVTVSNASNEVHRHTLRNAADESLLFGEASGDAGSNLNASSTVYGKFTLSAPTDIKLTLWADAGKSTIGLGKATDLAGVPEVYADLRIWKLDSNIETTIISDPALILARPLLHVQHQLSSGDTPADAVDGMNDLALNTVLVNEISGASLAAAEVVLPAGTYYISGVGTTRIGSEGAFGCQGHIRDSLDNILLTGIGQGKSNSSATSSTDSFAAPVEGQIILPVSTNIKLTTWLADTGSTGLGQETNAPTEIYADLRIWQLDAVIKAPVLVNDKLFPLPGNVIVTGNMHGLEYAYKDANTITVQAGICMDSTNEFILSAAAAQDVVIPGGVDTIYNLFLTDDAGTVKTDTDVDGAGLPAQDKRRWIGFVLTDGSGEVFPFIQSGDAFDWLNPDDFLLADSITTETTVDINPYVPVLRIKTAFIRPTVNQSGNYYSMVFQEGASATSTLRAACAALGAWSGGSTPHRMPVKTGIFPVDGNHSAAQCYFVGVGMKR